MDNIYNNLMSATDKVNGNIFAYAQDKECKTCGGLDGHVCTKCGMNIGIMGCYKREGLCISCFENKGEESDASSI